MISQLAAFKNAQNYRPHSDMSCANSSNGGKSARSSNQKSHQSSAFPSDKSISGKDKEKLLKIVEDEDFIFESSK
jgi:hypothetical protein